MSFQHLPRNKIPQRRESSHNQDRIQRLITMLFTTNHLHSSPPSSRLRWVDALRGFAILAMIPANLLHYYAEPHPLWYRVFASCAAAPIFIAVSAGMVVLGSGNRSLAYYACRGGYAVLIGAVPDLGLWRIVPFVSMDVL